MLRLGIVLLLMTCLGGCGVLGSSPQAKRSLEQMVEPTPQKAPHDLSAAPPRSAMAMLPQDAGTILKISSQAFSDGRLQVIGYDQSVTGLKANEIRIAVVKPISTAILDRPGRSAPREKPTEDAIRATLASDFPGMPMRIVNTPRSNDYGVYGLAAGQWANGVRCIYAWQWIEPLKSVDDGTLASVRIRLCRSDVTLDQLAEFVDHLVVDPARSETNIPVAVAESITPSHPARNPRAAADTALANPAAKPVATQSVLRRLAAIAPTPSLALQSTASNEATSEPDPGLPAAAYRGPSVLARTASQ